MGSILQADAWQEESQEAVCFVQGSSIDWEVCALGKVILSFKWELYESISIYSFSVDKFI